MESMKETVNEDDRLSAEVDLLTVNHLFYAVKSKGNSCSLGKTLDFRRSNQMTAALEKARDRMITV